MIRLLMFFGVGMTLAAWALFQAGNSQAFSWMFGTGIGIASLCGIVWLVAQTMRGQSSASPKLLKRAVAEGRGAMARIDRIDLTGIEINDQPLCKLELTVQPLCAPAYRVRLRRVVRLTEIPEFTRGSLHPAVMLTEFGPETALLDFGQLQVDVRQQLADVEVPSAESAGDVQVPPDGIVRDDGTRRAPILGRGRRGRLGRVTLYGIVIIVGFSLSLLPYHRTVDYALHALPQGRLKLSSWDAYYLEDALPRFEEELGHNLVHEVSFSSVGVHLDAPLGTNTTNTDEWTIRGSNVAHGEPTSIQPESTAEFFTLDEVRWDALDELVQESIVLAGVGEVAPDDVSLFIGRDTDNDVHSATFSRPVGDVTIRITVRGAYADATFTSDADGTNLTQVR